MKLQIEKSRQVTVVMIDSTALDASNKEEFQKQIAPILEVESKLIFNLEKLDFVDSSGLGAFLTCLRKVNRKGGDLKLCNMNRNLKNLFEMVRMNKVFEIYGSCLEAVGAFNS